MIQQGKVESNGLQKAGQTSEPSAQNTTAHVKTDPDPPDKAVPSLSGENSRLSVADRLFEVARQEGELSRGQTGIPYITVLEDGLRRTYALSNPDFEAWLRRRYIQTYRTSPTKAAIKEAKANLTAFTYQVEKKPVFTRIGRVEDVIYYDLANSQDQIVKITRDGWEIITGAEAPVLFHRPKGMRAQVVPVRGGRLDELRQVINAPTDEIWIAVSGWLVTCFNVDRPYLILAFTGRNGSAKTYTSKVLKRVIDPSSADLRGLPKNDKDLAVAAINAHVLAFDNLSGISPSTSDSLCQLATGFSRGFRELYTDGQEYAISVKRPMILNGIESIVKPREDLNERTLSIDLPQVSSPNRKTEAELDKAFEEMLPQVLGALFDAVSAALRNEDQVEIEEKPRMIDAAIFGSAADPALGREIGDFAQAMGIIRKESAEDFVQGNAFANSIYNFVNEGISDGKFDRLLDGTLYLKGRISDLWTWIEENIPPETRREESFPGGPTWLTRLLPRIETALESAHGIRITAGRDSSSAYWEVYVDASEAVDAPAADEDEILVGVTGDPPLEEDELPLLG